MCNAFEDGSYSEDFSPVKGVISAYRFGKRAYNIYKRTGKLTVDKLRQAGLDEIVGYVDNLNTIFGRTSTPWDRVNSTIDLLVGARLPDRWVASVGTYIGKFADDIYYVGKGAVERMNTSLSNLAKNYKTCVKDKTHNGGAYLDDLLDQGSIDRASFKEETVLMERMNAQSVDLYNKINSPGYKYIAADGF